MTDLLEGVFSEQVGLIPWLSETICPSLFAGPVTLFDAQSGRLKELHPQLDLRLPPGAGTVTGAGCACNPELARRKAVFEALERYAAVVYSPSEICTARAREIDDPCLAWRDLPELFVRHDAQSPWRREPFDPDKPIRWIRGYNLITGEDTFAPLVMVHTFLRALDGEEFWPQTTTGVAAHQSIEEALTAALFELVERDALEAVWMTRPPLRRIVMDTCQSAELDSLRRADELLCVDQHYFDATTDLGVPTVLAIRVVRPPIGHDIIISCASHWTFEQALLKARLEAGGQQVTRIQEARGNLYSGFVGEEGHLVSDAMQERPDLDFLCARRNASIPLSQIGAGEEESLERLVAKLSAGGREIILFNLTTDELRKLGVCVIRALVPTLMAVSPSAHQKFLEHPRLGRVAHHFGIQRPSLDQLSLAPHAFR